MRIRIRTDDIDAPADHARGTERRVRRAIGRLARRVSRVAVRLFDVNGPRGGIDKACEVTVWLGRAGTIHYSAIASSALAARTLALDGTRDAVRRRLALDRECRRRLARRRRDAAMNFDTE